MSGKRKNCRMFPPGGTVCADTLLSSLSARCIQLSNLSVMRSYMDQASLKASSRRRLVLVVASIQVTAHHYFLQAMGHSQELNDASMVNRYVRRQGLDRGQKHSHGLKN
uniref:Uncharacterized protein n=1 Tax=Timema cristinae TaxID=61476 RepID=A0A7R9GUF3_TIMCR|nr:unnamed protein product [Timema cristinae]